MALMENVRTLYCSATILGCNMKIRFNVSSDGKCLQIAEANLEHNHEISKDLFISLPKQRRLQDTEKRRNLEIS
ncbi:hypothetical protein NQ314_003942 [Rhamnusium bicolor]|uniref:FAR1 domain-containing protein n=1 Tax=Rhamnusium bicolor TaxID=1586634 RepID=A0AAV8ZLW0_9CUCU|nr:hypothetical protein NQ314_003942 [Rhamnusium bicolor]